jgi:hypothetical protein
MPNPVVELLPFALLAALSPLAFAATLAVMQTSRLRALAFGVGFVAAQLSTCGLFVVVGVAVTGASSRNHSDLVAVLEVVLAVALVITAVRLRRRPRKGRTGPDRTRAMLERLGRIRVTTGLVAGVLLGIGGPKRLLLAALAATVVTAAGTDGRGQAALVVVYGTVATVLVWAPITAFLLVGERTVTVMRAAQETLAARQREVSFYALLLVASLLALDAAKLFLD